MLEFRILGPLEVSDETGPLLLGGLKQRTVLALLLLEAGRVVSQDRLIYSLWVKTPPRTAVTSLQNFVSQLRKALGPEILETKSPGYRLDVASELSTWSASTPCWTVPEAQNRTGARSCCARRSRSGAARRSRISRSRRSPSLT